MYLNVTPTLRLIFVILTLVFLSLALVFRIIRKRKISDIMELFATGFFFAFCLQFIFTFNFANADNYTNPNNIAYLLLFVVSLVLVVYKTIFFIRGK